MYKGGYLFTCFVCQRDLSTSMQNCVDSMEWWIMRQMKQVHHRMLSRFSFSLPDEANKECVILKLGDFPFMCRASLIHIKLKWLLFNCLQCSFLKVPPAPHFFMFFHWFFKVCVVSFAHKRFLTALQPFECFRFVFGSRWKVAHDTYLKFKWPV